MGSKGSSAVQRLVGLLHEWEREASERESRVRRGDPEDTPATRRVLSGKAVTFRRCAMDLKRELGRG
jgi:hypothetical protein